MLPERVFVIGGGLSIAAGALLATADLLNPNPLFWSVLSTAGLFVGFGAFFLHVGGGARRYRRRLLDSPQPPP